MSILVSDENHGIAQCFRLPLSGASTTLTTVSGANVSSAALSAGIYRIVSGTDISLSSGLAGSTALATDLLLKANMAEYFYINDQWTINVYDAGVGGSSVVVTRMP